MAPKLPGKFDDISKPAASVLGDDFQCSGYQFKSKTKTNVGGGNVDLQVDLFGKGDVQTPAKLTFKFPTPFSFAQGLAIDKFELDKGGKAKLECSLNKTLHKVDGLKVDVKSDFAVANLAAQSLAYAVTYTGLSDAAVKAEGKQSNLADVNLECLYGIKGAVIGAKIAGTSNPVPDVGVNYKAGDMFVSVFAKKKFTEFTIHKHYKVSDDIQVAATYQHGGSKSGTYAAGATAKLPYGVTGKGKFDGSALSLACKKDLAKGTTFMGGMSYNLSTSAMTFGAKVSVE